MHAHEQHGIDNANARTSTSKGEPSCGTIAGCHQQVRGIDRMDEIWRESSALLATIHR
jgi:hypothetical protein